MHTLERPATHELNDEQIRDLFRVSEGVLVPEKSEQSLGAVEPAIKGNTCCSLSHGDIRSFIEENIPERARSVIGKIEFRRLTSQEQGGESSWMAYARYRPDAQDSYIALSTDVLKWWQEERETEEIDREVLMTIAHEYGHALHYVASPDVLREWLDARGEPLAAPDSDFYATTESDVPEQEDFAESFALYICDPDELYRLSPEHYDAMDELVARIS